MGINPKTGFASFKKLLASKDAEGMPWYLAVMCSDERGPGKTFGGCGVLMEHYEETEERFVLLMRLKGKTGHYASPLMKPYMTANYPGSYITESVKQNGVYTEVWKHTPTGDDGAKVSEHIGYTMSLVASDDIKAASGEFQNVTYVMFDEFQPGKNKTYLPDEIESFETILESIDRGGKDFVRPLRVLLLGNTKTLTNPYYDRFGLTQNITAETKFYKGIGIVYEKVINYAVRKARTESGLGRLLGRNAETFYDENSYSGDSNVGVERPDASWGLSTYQATLYADGSAYAVRSYPDKGLMYVDTKVDKTSNQVMRVERTDDPTKKLLRASRLGVRMRQYQNEGNMRYSSLTVKAMAMRYLL